MYSWDLTKIDQNLELAKKISPEFYKRQLSLYQEAISTYSTDIDKIEETKTTDKKTLYQLVSLNFIDLIEFRNVNTKLYEKIKSASQIETSMSIKTDHDFDLDEVYDICKSFFDSISKNFGLHLEQMKVDKELALNKSIRRRASYFPNNLTINPFVGVNARNKEEMAFSLVHELGHSIKKEEMRNGFGETLPILLELYLNDFIQENKIKYDTIPILNNRFVTERNENIDIFREYSKVNIDRVTTSKIFSIVREFYIKKNSNLYGIDEVLDYFLSTEIALDLYKKGEDKLQTIEDFLRREKRIYNIFDLAKITSPDVIDNDETIKRLLRKR